MIKTDFNLNDSMIYKIKSIDLSPSIDLSHQNVLKDVQFSTRDLRLDFRFKGDY